MLYLLVEIFGYIDFYLLKEYVINVGLMFCDLKNVLLLNWLEMLIGYNGCVLLVVVSGMLVWCLNG